MTREAIYRNRFEPFSLFLERKRIDEKGQIGLTYPAEITLTGRDKPHMFIQVFLALANECQQEPKNLSQKPSELYPFDLVTLYKVYLSDNGQTGYLGCFLKGIGATLILGKDSLDIAAMTEKDRKWLGYWAARDTAFFTTNQYSFCLRFDEKHPTPTLETKSAQESRIFYRQSVTEKSLEFNPYRIKERGTPVPRVSSNLPVQIHIFQSGKLISVLYAQHLPKDDIWQISQPDISSQTQSQRFWNLQQNVQTQLTLPTAGIDLSLRHNQRAGVLNIAPVNKPDYPTVTTEVWIPND